jgi:hypothetical protein
VARHCLHKLACSPMMSASAPSEIANRAGRRRSLRCRTLEAVPFEVEDTFVPENTRAESGRMGRRSWRLPTGSNSHARSQQRGSRSARATTWLLGVVAVTAMAATTPKATVVVERGARAFPPGKPLGIVANQAGSYPGVYEALDTLGLQFVRFDLTWGEWRRDPYHLSAELQLPPGVQALVNLSYYVEPGDTAPSYGGYDLCPHQPMGSIACIPRPDSRDWLTFLNGWSNFVSTVLAQYHDSVHYWGVWNEPNEKAFFVGTEQQYDAMAAAACNIVRSYGDHCVGPDLALHADTSRMTTILWLNRRLQNVPFDIASIHIYDSLPALTAAVDTVRSVIGNVIPLWVTESGPHNPDSGFMAKNPEEQERDVVKKARAMLNSQTNAQAIFLYDLMSHENGISDLFTYDRPAYYALKELLTGKPVAYRDPPQGYCTNSSGSWQLCQSQPLGTTIRGPSTVTAGMFYTWSATVTGGVAPYTYQWSGPLPGSSSAVSGSLQSSDFLQLDVWDSTNQHASWTLFVTVCDNNQISC